ncbi:MAG: glycosyltransferase [Anaerolineales bacterium]
MKIVLTSHGTRGDVQPYLALAVGLQKAGHQVTLATSYNFTEWIQSYGVGVHPTRFSVQEEMRKPGTQAAMKSRNFFRLFGMMREMMKHGAEATEEVWAAVQSAEFVIDSPTSSGALEAAELRGVPVALAYPVPFAPTRAFPSFFMGQPRFSFGPGYNRLTHTLMHRLLWSGMSAPLTNAWRKKLGLKPWRSYAEQRAYAKRLGTPSLYGFSAHVLPRPDDWDELQHITGYWFLESPSAWQPSPELLQFLENGPLPVYIGYGSINVGDSESKTRLILRALELSGQRGVVLTGWGGLKRLPAPPTIFFVDNVPHDWLFPRMAAVAHHGGAGTTGAGLRAGVPSIITPFAGDQASWAERVAQLGVGPRAPGIRSLTAEKLATAINLAVNDSALRARAAALGQKIRAEDGIARAVEVIERHAQARLNAV